MGPAPAEFLQELVRRNIEGILLKGATDDDHRMGSHDVDDRLSGKLPEMVGANDGIFMTAPQVVYARLELDDIVDMRSIPDCPVHATTNAAKRERGLGAAAG